MGNISSFIGSSALTLSNLILVTPQDEIGYQPQNGPVNNGQLQQQPPGILFHYEGEQTVTLQSDITTHYSEENLPIQDQVALQPIFITTHGFVGELNDVAPIGFQTLKAVADKLTVISGYTPGLSVAALNAYNEALYAYQTAVNVADAGVAAWSSLTKSGITVQNLQQQYFSSFYGYWESKTLFTVQTPWAVFENAVIQKLRAIQDETTNTITDFEVTFQVLRIVDSLTDSIDVSNLQTRAANQAMGGNPVDRGITNPPTAPQSFGSMIGK